MRIFKSDSDLGELLRWRKKGGMRMIFTSSGQLMTAELKGGYTTIREGVTRGQAISYAASDGWKPVAHKNDRAKKARTPRPVGRRRPLKGNPHTPRGFEPILEEKIRLHQERVEREMATMARNTNGTLR